MRASITPLATQLESFVPGPAGEKRFWRRVDEIAWNKHAPRRMLVDVGGLHRELMASTTVPELIALRKREQLLFEALKVRLAAWYEERGGPQIELEDKELTDLMHHIVGLGQTSYEATLKRPALAKTRATRGGFCESFSYVFDWRDDAAYVPQDVERLLAIAEKPKRYSVRVKPEVGQVLDHKTFGRGMVIAMDGLTRAYIVFEDDERALVVGR